MGYTLLRCNITGILATMLQSGVCKGGLHFKKSYILATMLHKVLFNECICVSHVLKHIHNTKSPPNNIHLSK